MITIEHANGNNLLIVQKAIVAIELADVLYGDRVDRSGKRHATHLHRVALKLQQWLRPVNTIIGGALHDYFEDFPLLRIETLQQLGFPLRSLTIAKHLTHDVKSEEYAAYINRLVLLNDVEVLWVELADLEDNTCDERARGLDKKGREWWTDRCLTTYNPAKKEIREALGLSVE